MSLTLESLTAGMAIPWGGDKVALVSKELAAAFVSGDRLVVVNENGDLLHIPATAAATAAAAVGRSAEAFTQLAEIGNEEISAFFEEFARRLSDEEVWEQVAAANAGDVARATAAGRSTTRLRLAPTMGGDMVAGLRAWRDAPPGRDRAIERIDHEGWCVELSAAPLGVVGFVFEGRPNVFVDAAGVIRGGNTAVFRIGRDALETARAIERHALKPALLAAGLPVDAAVLLDSPDHAAGWALFSDRRLSLAVARGSGAAVAQLGAVARQSGVAVSLHGTGGAWLFADASADAERFAAAVFNSLDRKACNTLNVCCLIAAPGLIPSFLDALQSAGERRGHGCKLHIAEGWRDALPQAWREARTTVRRADGDHDELLVEEIAIEKLGREWEWEETPEASLVLVESLDEAIELFNLRSPLFIASLLSADAQAQASFRARINAPFTGDGFTRWVDGQYALGRPELGLSNWQGGRLFGRGGVLSGDGVFTVRAQMRQVDPVLKR
ncbi:MAG TPA: glutamate-5-semialdehyde dehydrogenase [Caulobacteraceae bacterium]|jgi:glutamate-5-semialdehyde dehydrogenase|nr:glutamate-5-semialdehyde dehydrogenase [Caulobacteraceae bacterium]